MAPRPDFAADLRERLMREAESVLTPQAASLRLPVGQRGRRERRLVAVASAFVIIGSTTTMAAAAQGSLPGEALYPVKRVVEQAEAAFTTSPDAKGHELLDQASTRLTEAHDLLQQRSIGQGSRVATTLQAFSSSAQDGSALLFRAYQESSDPADVVAVRSFTADSMASLRALAGTAPNDAQGDLAAAAVVLHDIDTQAVDLCGSCSADRPPVEVPANLLARVDVDRAMSAAATEQLENNHPVVVDKGALASAQKALKTAGPTAAPSAAPKTPVASATPVLPAPTWDPTSWPTLLPGTSGSSTSTSTSGGTSTSGQLSKDLQDGLTGVVKTLLPDAGN